MKADNFAKETAIVVAMNRIIGVRTFHHSNTRLWLSLSFLYKLVLMTGLGYTMYYNFQTVDEDVLNYLTSDMYTYASFFSSLCGFTTQTLGLLYCKETTQLRKKIADTDQNLIKLNVLVDHRNMSLWIIIMCACCVFNGVAYFIIYSYKAYKSAFPMNYFLDDIIYGVLLTIGGMVLMDFMAHVCWLGDNFKLTNDLLKKFFVEECQIGMEEWNNKMVCSWLERCLNEWHIERISRRNKIIPYIGTRIMKRQLYPVNKISMLQKIRYVHLQLCVIMKSMNDIFTMQIMCHSVVTTLNLAGVLYYSYMQLLEPVENDNNLTDFLIIYMIDGIYVWLKVVAVCFLCENTAKETKKVAQILQVCSIHNSDFELKHELIQFSVQVSISKLGNKHQRLFPLNYMFIAQSIGAMFTYFLIMVQWTPTVNAPPSSSSNWTVTSPSPQ